MMPIERPKYDLEERTAHYGEEVIKFCKNIRKDAINSPLINQLIRSGTSIGANYMEANGASSRRDFANKIFICKKEAQETKHWFRMISAATPECADIAGKLWQEAQELTLIFQKIASSTRNNN